MYINKIVLKNIRGFENLEFDLDRGDGAYAGWTVFTGDNGSGKSTLLKAIAVGLTGKDTSRSLQPSFNRWIREGVGTNEASIQLDIVRSSDDEVADYGNTSKNPNFPAKICLTNGGKETTLQSAIPHGKLKNYATPDRTIWSPNAKGWFSCGYGPFRRVFGASSQAARQMVAPSTEKFVTMFEEAASLAEVDEWLRKLHHMTLESKADATVQLNLLLSILRDDLLPNEITVDHVDSGGLWLKDRNGVQLAWPEMSDGYRSALALLTDIVRHLINAYGVEGLTGTGEDGKLYVKRSGVVLIDEIDAHLHPEWQRTIGFWLKKHFPNIQFLVTTHSPIICQAADINGLFVLPEPGSHEQPRPLSLEEYWEVIASRPDTILLSSAFGLQNTRSPRAVESRAVLSKLQAKKHAGGTLTKEEAELWAQSQPFVATDEEL